MPWDLPWDMARVLLDMACGGLVVQRWFHLCAARFLICSSTPLCTIHVHFGSLLLAAGDESGAEPDLMQEPSQGMGMDLGSQPSFPAESAEMEVELSASGLRQPPQHPCRLLPYSTLPCAHPLPPHPTSVSVSLRSKSEVAMALSWSMGSCLGSWGWGLLGLEFGRRG